MGKKGFSIADLAKQAMGEAAVSNLDTGADAVSNLDTVRSIPREQIRTNEANFYEMSDLEELAASIELAGLLHPILVKPDGDGYVIIDGERRFRALTEVLEEPDVPCIVRRPLNGVIEELMLIEANRTQRKLSDGDLSKQAERYTELLAQLRDTGVTIPGRLRDRVAEALQVSAAKLARLHAIRERLEPGLLAIFDDGDLSESAAYELSKFDRMKQARIWDNLACTNRSFTVENVMRAAAEDDVMEADEEAAWLEGHGHPEDTAADAVSKLDTGSDFDGRAYLAERQAEDDDYFLLLNEAADSFLPALAAVNSRQEGIQKLKDTFGKARAEHGDAWMKWDAEPRGLAMQSKGRKILRTWTDVYDMLCTIALNQAAVSSGLKRIDRPENTAVDAVSELDTEDEDDDIPVSKLDTGAALIHWHETTPENMPPEFAPPGSAILLWGEGGLSRTPDALVKMTISAMPESARWWAVVKGPEEDDDG